MRVRASEDLAARIRDLSEAEVLPATAVAGQALERGLAYDVPDVPAPSGGDSIALEWSTDRERDVLAWARPGWTRHAAIRTAIAAGMGVVHQE